MSHNRRVPKRILDLELPNRAIEKSARKADLDLLSKAPEGFLDTTHFDTVRFPPPAWAEAIIKEKILDGNLAYSPYRGHEEVRGILGQSISDFMGVDYNKENIILTPGTQAGLFVSLSSITANGEKICLMNPDYLFNARILGFLGSEVCYVPIGESSTNPKPDLNVLEEEFKNGARILEFSNPNNPTGYVYSKEELQEISELAIKYDAIVVVDALYSRLLHENHPYYHLAAFPGMKDRVITLLGPSKTESLSGYRLGVVVGPGHIMPQLENVLSVIALRAPAYSQYLLTHWLNKDHDWVANLIDTFTNLREMTISSFRKLPWLKIEPQRGTAYAWPDVSALGISDEEVATELLTKASVLVSPGYQFGPGKQGHFRVCYARDEKEWSNALERMVKVLEELAIKSGI